MSYLVPILAKSLTASDADGTLHALRRAALLSAPAPATEETDDE